MLSLSTLNPAPSFHPQTRKTIHILNAPIHVMSLVEIISVAEKFMMDDRPHHIITANSLLVMEAQKNPSLREILAEADLVVPESSGLTWAAHRLKLEPIHRVAGIDLAKRLCALAEWMSVPVYLLGATPEVVKRAADHLYSEFPWLQIGGRRDGYFRERDEPSIVHDIALSRSRLVLVALGMPNQEKWIHQHLKELPPALYLGVGGSFDIWGGKVKRAPRWMRHQGMEWIYRLWQEPYRWRRISRLPRFALKIYAFRQQNQSCPPNVR